MTGQKDRYSTTEKLWNLDDKQLTTPEHDELVLKLLDEEYIKQTLIPETHRTELELQIISEKPLTGRNGFIVGYCDVFVNAVCWVLSDRYGLQCPKCKNTVHVYDTKEDALAALNNKKYAHCGCSSNNTPFLITKELIYQRSSRCDTQYYIECKPKITSFGETLRQLQTYRETVCRSGLSGIFVLFTPDTRFKKAFESQGIKVISP